MALHGARQEAELGPEPELHLLGGMWEVPSLLGTGAEHLPHVPSAQGGSASFKPQAGRILPAQPKQGYQGPSLAHPGPVAWYWSGGRWAGFLPSSVPCGSSRAWSWSCHLGVLPGGRIELIGRPDMVCGPCFSHHY